MRDGERGDGEERAKEKGRGTNRRNGERANWRKALTNF